MQFPKDHYAHLDCKVEWWYFAGMGDLDGVGSVNYHVSFFRKFGSVFKKQIYFAHFGITINGEFEFKETKNEDIFNETHRTHCSDESLDFYIGNWGIGKFMDQYLVSLEKEISLTHIAKKRPIVHSPRYYSITDMDVKGAIKGNAFKGKGWFDHEFFEGSSLQLALLEYKWFALQLETGIEIMIGLLPKHPAKAFGTIVFPKGESKKILPGDYCLKPGATNFGWILELPDYGMEFSLEKQSEAKITHALGPDYIEGTFNVVSRKKIGQGFYEITGGEL